MINNENTYAAPTPKTLTQPHVAALPKTPLELVVYTPKEVQQLLRLSKNTVNALLNTGQLGAVRCGRKWLVPGTAIVSFLAKGGCK